MATLDLDCAGTNGIEDFYYLPKLKHCYFRFATSCRLAAFSITGYTDRPFTKYVRKYEPDVIEPIIAKITFKISIPGDYKCKLTEIGDKQYRISFLPNDIHSIFYVTRKGNTKCKQIVSKLCYMYKICNEYLVKDLILCIPLLRLELNQLTDNDLHIKSYKCNYDYIESK